MASSTRRGKADPESKASIRRNEMAETHGADMIGSNGEIKGKTRQRDNGELEFYDEQRNAWRPAAYHEQFRQDFIEFAAADHPYSIGPRHGVQPYDVTANCSYLNQNLWNFEPQHWDNIVDEQGNKVLLLPNRPNRSSQMPQAEPWEYNGLILLDMDDHPVIAWPNIPLTFSSELEGGRMEALRRVFPWLKVSDFRARMPRTVLQKSGETIALSGPSTFGQRMSRFRNTARCAAWSELGRRTQCKRGSRREPPDSDQGDEAQLKKAQMSPPRRAGSDQIHELAGDSSTPGPSGNDPGLKAFTSDPNMAYPWYQNVSNHVGGQQQTIAPRPTGLGVDLRYIIPRTFQEQVGIKVALSLTRADFEAYHGYAPPHTPPEQSYDEQFNQIQHLHDSQWKIGPPLPVLAKIGFWSGSFEVVSVPPLSDTDASRVAAGSILDFGS